MFSFERKLEPLVMDNNIWEDQRVWERQSHSLSASQSVDCFPGTFSLRVSFHSPGAFTQSLELAVQRSASKQVEDEC